MWVLWQEHDHKQEEKEDVVQVKVGAPIKVTAREHRAIVLPRRRLHGVSLQLHRSLLHADLIVYHLR